MFQIRDGESISLIMAVQQQMDVVAPSQHDADLGRNPPSEPTMTGALPEQPSIGKLPSYSEHVDRVADQMGKCHLPP